MSSSLEYFLSAKSRSRHSISTTALITRSSLSDREEEQEEEDCVTCQGWVNICICYFNNNNNNNNNSNQYDEKRVFCKLLQLQLLLQTPDRRQIILKVYRNTEQQFQESLYDFNVTGVDRDGSDCCSIILRTTCEKTVKMRLDSLELFNYWYNGFNSCCFGGGGSGSGFDSLLGRKVSDEGITMLQSTNCSLEEMHKSDHDNDDQSVVEERESPVSNKEEFREILSMKLSSLHDSLLNAITSTTRKNNNDDHHREEEDILEKIKELLSKQPTAAPPTNPQINGIAQSLKQVSEFLGRQVDLQNSSERLLHDKIDKMLKCVTMEERSALTKGGVYDDDDDQQQHELRDYTAQNSTVLSSKLDYLLEEIASLKSSKSTEDSEVLMLLPSIDDKLERFQNQFDAIKKSQETTEKILLEFNDSAAAATTNTTTNTTSAQSLLDQFKQLLQTETTNYNHNSQQSSSRSPSPSRRLSEIAIQDERMHEIQKSMYYVKDKLSELGRSVDHLNANVISTTCSPSRDKSLNDPEIVASIQREVEKVVVRNLDVFGEELKQRQTALEHRLNNSDKHLELKTEIKDSTADLKQSIDGTIQSVGKEVLGLKSGIEGFSKELQSIVSELKQQQSAVDSKDLSFSEVLAEQKRCLSKLLCDIDSKRSELQEITVQYERLDASVQQLTAVKATMETDIERERNILHTLKTQSSLEHSQLVSEVATLKEQRSRLLNQVSLLEGSSSSSEIRRERRNTE